MHVYIVMWILFVIVSHKFSYDHSTELMRSYELYVDLCDQIDQGNAAKTINWWWQKYASIGYSKQPVKSPRPILNNLIEKEMSL